MICKKCGFDNSNDSAFCGQCGNSLSASQQVQQINPPPTGNQGTAQNASSATKGNPDIPRSYTPITMWGYIGLEILFSIPVIGLIFVILFSAGVSRYRNVRNFARSCLFWIILEFVLFVLCCIYKQDIMNYIISLLT